MLSKTIKREKCQLVLTQESHRKLLIGIDHNCRKKGFILFCRPILLLVHSSHDQGFYGILTFRHLCINRFGVKIFYHW